MNDKIKLPYSKILPDCNGEITLIYKPKTLKKIEKEIAPTPENEPDIPTYKITHNFGSFSIEKNIGNQSSTEYYDTLENLLKEILPKIPGQISYIQKYDNPDCVLVIGNITEYYHPKFFDFEKNVYSLKVESNNRELEFAEPFKQAAVLQKILQLNYIKTS